MYPKKGLSIRSATVAGIAASVLLGLTGLTLNPAPAKAVVYCQYVGYPAHCIARAGVVLRPRPVARAAVRHNAGGNPMVASIALGCGGKAIHLAATRATANSLPSRAYEELRPAQRALGLAAVPGMSGIALAAQATSRDRTATAAIASTDSAKSYPTPLTRSRPISRVLGNCWTWLQINDLARPRLSIQREGRHPLARKLWTALLKG